MKSIVNNPEPKDFPMPMKSPTNGLVVLFTSKARGFVVHSGNSTYDVGYFSDGWAPSSFIPLTGSVTLSNQ